MLQPLPYPSRLRRAGTPGQKLLQKPDGGGAVGTLRVNLGQQQLRLREMIRIPTYGFPQMLDGFLGAAQAPESRPELDARQRVRRLPADRFAVHVQGLLEASQVDEHAAQIDQRRVSARLMPQRLTEVTFRLFPKPSLVGIVPN